MITVKNTAMRAVAMATLTMVLGVAGIGPVFAKATPEELAKLGLSGTELTPAGAIRAGNAEGTIPVWQNRPIEAPANFQPGTYHVDPFANDPVLFKITAQNYQDYADKLTVGQQQMFQIHPDFYMNVYPTRRSAVFQPYIYEAALKNAGQAEVVISDNGIVAFEKARKAWAFPVPHDGNEALMNMSTRPITPWLNSHETTLAVTSSGKYVVNKLNIQKREKWSDAEISDAEMNPSEDALFYYQTLLAPPKLAGQVVLARDPQRFTEKLRSAWAYSPGQRRVKRAPQIVYDNPLTASDGLATTDQKWGFNGPNDRFNWTLVGRKEIYVPYNAYKLHSADATPDKVVTAAGRVNQEFARYELHRVWVVESTLKKTTNHDYGRRTFYLDEDSWWIMLVDGYDRRNQIWRYWESHDVMYYDIGFMNAAAEFQYDMQAGRMIALMWDKQNPPDFSWREDDSYFTPASVRRRGVR